MSEKEIQEGTKTVSEQQEEAIEEKKAGEPSDTDADFAAFCQIIGKLRSENGCPWDRAQTFESLKPCMVNEMTEALAGIDLYRKSGNAANLCEELGDVLLQVVLLSQIAKEEGLFDIHDVIREISKKMVHRHPHVFGTPEEREKKRSWEELKREEKRERTGAEEEAERAAFHEAAGWVICHLAEK